MIPSLGVDALGPATSTTRLPPSHITLMFEFVLTGEVESNGLIDGEGKSKWVFWSPLQECSGRRLTQIKLASMGSAVDVVILFFHPCYVLFLTPPLMLQLHK